VACLLFWVTWAHWGDIQVHCGREVYVPYEILRGKLLYRDLWYPYGPLEPYVSAVLLKLFGEHLTVLYALGLALTISCALVLFEIGAIVEGRAVGLTAALVLLLQAFQPSYFDYIFPYTYSSPMGLLFALLFLFLVLRNVLGRPGQNLLLAGMMAALALLTRQEMGIACYLSIAFFLVTQTVVCRSLRASLGDAVVFLPGLVVAVAIYGCFFWKVTPSAILYANWHYTPRSYAWRNYATAYSYAIGLRFGPIETLLLIIDAALAIFLWRRIALISALHGGHFEWRFCAVALFAIGMAAARRFAPLAMYVILAVFIYPRGMFFIGCAFFVYTLYRLSKCPNDRRLLSEAVLSAFALAFAVRVLAQIIPAAYSIFYDPPLVLIFIVAIARSVELSERSRAGEAKRRVLNSVLVVEVLAFAIMLVPGAAGRTARLGTSWGAIYLRPSENSVVHQISDFIMAQKQRGRQVTLLPELPMLYALTGTEAPSRWYTTIVSYLSPEQEEDYIADLARAHPNYIVLTNRQNPEVNTPYFGVDYNQKIYRWIQANYRVTRQFGHFSRNGSRDLAALLYERRDESALAAH
jgi:hypothetical protein